MALIMSIRVSVGGAIARSLRVLRRATRVRNASLLSSANVRNTGVLLSCFRAETRRTGALQALLSSSEAIILQKKH